VVSVARESRLIVGAEVMGDRGWEHMQSYADELPLANRYCTDELAVYGDLLWPPNPEGGNSSYVVSHGKDETYTIEGVNADLRTYLGRLKRRSRCFSRCIQALRRALRLFVWYYNKRQRIYNTNPILKGNLCLLF
jgi:insertion element IS1 protein InsB